MTIEMENAADHWHVLASRVAMEGRAFINGEYREARTGETFECASPIDGRHLAHVVQCESAEVEAAVAAARRAFAGGEWSRRSPKERKAVLLGWAALLRIHSDQLAVLETLDAGKPIGDVSNGDLPAAIYCLEWFAEAIDKIHGEVAPTGADFLGLVTREPLGVVAAVVPWNYPLLMAVWKFAPALAAGNSVILKPSEKSPLTAIRVAELGYEAGLPAGVFNVLPGDGRVGQLLSAHMDVDCIAFTGSGNVGRKIMQSAAQSNMKRVWLELGGKSPNIVMSDCADVARAAQAAATAIFANMGEVCSAGSRLLVHRAVKDELLERLVEATSQYQPGNPLDPSVNMGAIIDQAQLDKVVGYIESGRAEAQLLAGGRRVLEETGGYYVQPTVFDCKTNDTKIAREEIFGPVLSVMTFDNTDEALALANDTEYGLAAAVWTSDISTAHKMAGALRSGTVWVNCYDEIVDMNFPFGGYKQSGNGRDNSLHALAKYTELKSTIIRLR